MWRAFAFLLGPGVVLLLAAGASAVEPVASYDISVRLDPATHRLQGAERIRFRNASAAPTSELQLHLYLNAFAGESTTFMRELGSSPFRRHRPAGTGWGSTRVTALATADGTDLLPGLELIRPDDDNPDDATVARVPLPQPLRPGARVELDLAFEAQLPWVVARTGFAGDFHLVGQWFPKLGVLEDDGWSCHQLHAESEFYADFGSYRVEVEVPAGWVVAATGVEVGRSPLTVDGRPWQRVTFRADRVHDFAWTAAPGELMTTVEGELDPGRDVPPRWLEETGRLLGVGAAELELAPVRLVLVLPRDQAALAPRMLAAARLALAWCGLRYGPYPYPQLTVVSPPPTAEEAGGMEYPTLITTGASRLMSRPPLSSWPWVETVTVHELAHQVFYGLLASNEAEEAWLDEGLASYVEVSFLAALSRDRLVPGMLAVEHPWALQRAWLGTSGASLELDLPSWEYPSRGAYFRASYGKAAVVLRTLEGVLGEEALARGLRAYVDRFRFRHPTGADLEAVLAETSGRELGWFFDQAVRGRAVPDWAVTAVHQRRLGRTASGAAPAWRAEVGLERQGDFVAPVEVELTWADGRVERRTWEGDVSRPSWSLESPARLERVAVDPDGVWALEVDRADNAWRAEPDRGAARSLLWWLADLVAALELLWLPWS